MAGRSFLPAETWNYVRIVTGSTAEMWASKSPPVYEASTAPKGQMCLEIARMMAATAGMSHRRPITEDPAWGPWGVQLAGSFTEAGVLASYERLRRRFPAVFGDRLPEKTRADANAFCNRLLRAGGNCIVLKNPSY